MGHDSSTTLAPIKTVLVSIHAPARGTTHWWNNPEQFPDPFQSTRPQGARRATSHSILTGCPDLFQSTRPQGARRRVWAEGALQPACFNPRARKGHDNLSVFDEFDASLVSIHAPARGTTGRLLCRLRAGQVSIHAPARGTTKPNGCPLCTYGVSIHAPARGTTPISAT